MDDITISKVEDQVDKVSTSYTWKMRWHCYM